MKLRFTIIGEAVSKANSRQLVPTKSGKVRSIKSDKALAFEASMLRQIPTHARAMWTGRCAIRLHMFYASERPDLDESLVLDCLQARFKKVKRRNGSFEKVMTHRGVVVNDRQFRRKFVYHDIDKLCPRVEITVWKLDQQRALFNEAEMECAPCL
jgi:hypothetical protein